MMPTGAAADPSSAYTQYAMNYAHYAQQGYQGYDYNNYHEYYNKAGGYPTFPSYRTDYYKHANNGTYDIKPHEVAEAYTELPHSHDATLTTLTPVHGIGALTVAADKKTEVAALAQMSPAKATDVHDMIKTASPEGGDVDQKPILSDNAKEGQENPEKKETGSTDSPKKESLEKVKEKADSTSKSTDDVKVDGKPTMSYIALIAKAILESPHRRLSLGSIYGWIEQHYSYFKDKGQGWRNSVRHNLSLNDCFIKAGRCEDGKGNYWAVHPANLQDFMKGDFRQRRRCRRRRRSMMPPGSDVIYPTSSTASTGAFGAPLGATGLAAIFAPYTDAERRAYRLDDALLRWRHPEYPATTALPEQQAHHAAATGMVPAYSTGTAVDPTAQAWQGWDTSGCVTTPTSAGHPTNTWPAQSHLTQGFVPSQSFSHYCRS